MPNKCLLRTAQSLTVIVQRQLLGSFFFFEYQQRMATKVETGKTTSVAVITRDRVTDNLKTQLAIGQKFFVLLPTLCLQYT